MMTATRSDDARSPLMPDDADGPGPSRPFLPPPPTRLETDAHTPFRPRSAHMVPTSAIHFAVHPGIDALQSFAAGQGWNSRGWTELAVPWVELRYTTDGWKTLHVLSSSDVPCPIVNGYFYLPNVPRGTEVEFALQVGLSCHAPSDGDHARAESSLWLNNGGQNYRQTSR